MLWDDLLLAIWNSLALQTDLFPLVTLYSRVISLFLEFQYSLSP